MIRQIKKFHKKLSLKLNWQIKCTQLWTRLTWYVFIKKVNQFSMTSKITQPEPFSRPYSITQGKQICISGLDTAHGKFSITLEGKYQYKLMLIRSIQKHRLTISKWSLGQLTWKIFYTNQNNQLTWTSTNTQTQT